MPFIVDLPPKTFEEQKTEILAKNSKDNIYDDLESDTVLNLDKDLFENVYLREKFQSLLEEWYDETIFESSLINIIENEYFKEIIRMEKSAIPLIIDEIEKKPSVLVWALNEITGISFTNPKRRRTIEEVCKKWVYYYKSGRIKNI